MADITPTKGRIVLYTLNTSDVQRIVSKRAVHGTVGNFTYPGDTYPAMVVRTWGTGPDQAVNLQVFLDGEDTLWATSRHVGDQQGDYSWMDYQKGQAAKADTLEKKLAGS